MAKAENQTTTVAEGKQQRTIESFLEKKIVYLKPVPRPNSMLMNVGSNPDHMAYFKYDNTVDEFCLPLDAQTGRLKNPFESMEEMKIFSEEMDADLSTQKKDNTFWIKFRVRIRKDANLMKTGLRFDLSDPYENLQVRVLKMYKDDVCSDPTTLDMHPTTKYVLVDENYEVMAKVAKSDLNKVAYKHFGRIEDNRTLMTQLLRLRGNLEEIETTSHKVDGSASKEFLLAEIEKWIEKDPQSFVDTCTDKNFELKVFIQDALSIAALRRHNSTYSMPEGDILGRSLEETMNYFKAKENQDVYLLIKAKIDASQSLK